MSLKSSVNDGKGRWDDKLEYLILSYEVFGLSMEFSEMSRGGLNDRVDRSAMV